MTQYRCDLCPSTEEVELQSIRIGKITGAALDLCPDCKKKIVDFIESIKRNYKVTSAS